MRISEGGQQKESPILQVYLDSARMVEYGKASFAFVECASTKKRTVVALSRKPQSRALRFPYPYFGRFQRGKSIRKIRVARNFEGHADMTFTCPSPKHCLGRTSLSRLQAAKLVTRSDALPLEIRRRLIRTSPPNPIRSSRQPWLEPPFEF